MSNTQPASSPTINPAVKAPRITKKAQMLQSKQNLKAFREATGNVFVWGLRHRESASNMRKAAITALAMILGVHKDFFESGTQSEKGKYRDHLRHQLRANGFGKEDHRTTDLHLLSRMFRGSDRKLASSDAQILKFAIEKNITEETFPDWVNEYGSLTKVKKAILKKKEIESDDDSENPDDIAPEKDKPKAPYKPNTETKWIALKSIPIDEAPEQLKTLPTYKYINFRINNQGNRIEFLMEDTSVSPNDGNGEKDQGSSETSVDQTTLDQRNQSTDLH